MAETSVQVGNNLRMSQGFYSLTDFKYLITCIQGHNLQY